jgi:hypothetical protein
MNTKDKIMVCADGRLCIGENMGTKMEEERF